jgi:hypothetical protein
MSIVSNLVDLLGACMVGDGGCFVLSTTGLLRRGEQRAEQGRTKRREAAHEEMMI